MTRLNKYLTAFCISLFIFTNTKTYCQPPITCSVNITALPTCSTCCDGVVCVSSPMGGCNASYTYSFSSNGISSATPCENNFCYNTSYFVKVYDLCDTVTKFFTFPVFTGVKENFKSNPIKISPNPVSSILSISDEMNQFLNSEIKIVNTFGQIIFVKHYADKIDVSILEQGIYYLEISNTDKQIHYSKFIKN